MTLFTVSAILLLDTLAASASIGVSSITWWLILGAIFMVPYGMINAELGTTYPEQGGIYAWVRDTFGKRWSTRLSWLYWLNNVLWISSVLVLFSGIFAQIFYPDMGLGMKIAMCSHSPAIQRLTTSTACSMWGGQSQSLPCTDSMKSR